MSSEDNNDNPPRRMLPIEQPRPPRNMQDLLRYAVEVKESTITSSNFPPLDPERRRFLEDALRSMTVDVTKELSDSIKILKTLQNTESEQLSESEYTAALDKIAEHVDNIDAANDFVKLGGFDVASTCLASPVPGIRWRMADIIATCTQNNPFCQMNAVKLKFLQPLLTMVDQDEDKDCKIKGFFAVSSMVRDYPQGLEQFKKFDGFFVVLRAMKSPIKRLRNKATFFLSCIISQDRDIKEELLKMGFVEHLVSLIKGKHTSSHEHIISALLLLVKDYEDAQAECRKPELELRQTLQNILNEFGDDDAFREETEYIKSLMAIVFSNDN